MTPRDLASQEIIEATGRAQHIEDADEFTTLDKLIRATQANTAAIAGLFRYIDSINPNVTK